MSKSSMVGYTIENYQKQKPFSSFLSGIAGKMGIPLWAFYVNRGQLISSFGVRDKNGAIMEFFPANSAYHYVSRTGFRTFVKIEGKVFEFFKEQNQNQKMIIRQDSVSIEEENLEIGIKVKVTYFTLPNENISALVRKVEITNLEDKKIDVEVVDGLAQILPSGIDYGGYKAISNLLQSWMSSINEPNYVFYKLRASTDDSAEVNLVVDGNFYFTSANTKPLYISDYKLIFDEDTSLETPYQFINQSINDLSEIQQAHVNQVPCAMSGFHFKNLSKESFASVIGYASNKDKLDELSLKMDLDYLLAKETENKVIHDALMNAVETKTAYPMLDAYYKQCYLDNVLRGGTPLIFETLDGNVGYHIYSRKHGDLERDYNFFSLEPAFYSQGNGNFRDVLQNRRNDLFFYPELKDSNIYQFASLIQADGYNPLSIEGVKFTFEGDIEKQPKVLHQLLKEEFTPGAIATKLFESDLDVDTYLKGILLESHVVIKASFGEGYWEDHFTYIYDLLDSYLSIYPDDLSTLMFEKTYPFFVSPVMVLPRNQKYVLTKDKKVRQYGAIKHFHDQKSTWMKNKNGQVKVNLFGKLLTLILNKYGHLDPFGIGLSYEGNKPGWNDAMNGVPGLFGSGVSETIELKKLVQFLLDILKKHPDKEVLLLKSTEKLAKAYEHLDASEPFDLWNLRMTHLETYRNNLLDEQEISVNQANHYQKTLEKIDKDLDKALEKAKEIDKVYPTYITYEATDYQQILDENNQPVIGEYGLPVVNVKAFEMKPLPIFLEAPARYLKSLSSKEEAKQIYKNVKQTGLYDRKLKFYQTSVSLEDYDHEIGRIRAFTQGWLERESNFLHMTYKYLLGLLKSGLYEEFFEEIKTNYTCFMDPKVYGRSPIENSSFLATSSNPDPKKHGQGFVSRLTGSTAEVLSMWRYMFFGKQLFTLENGALCFTLSPKLPKTFFEEGKIEVRLFNKTTITYHLLDQIDTYDSKAYVEKMTLHKNNEVCEVQGSKVIGKWTKDIREGNVFKINVYIRGGK
ncbi:MAG: cellobiose phosphorylase [Tenericutes bacterium]|nr:cellobiose phosphorylase [Mycoplasmatota bacterium]